MSNEEEILLMKIELVETSDLVKFCLENQVPISQPIIVYLIERVRFLSKELADVEAELFKELQKQVTCN